MSVKWSETADGPQTSRSCIAWFPAPGSADAGLVHLGSGGTGHSAERQAARTRINNLRLNDVVGVGVDRSCRHKGARSTARKWRILLCNIMRIGCL